MEHPLRERFGLWVNKMRYPNDDKGHPFQMVNGKKVYSEGKPVEVPKEVPVEKKAEVPHKKK